MTDRLKATAVGLDFGTKSTVAALGDADGSTQLVRIRPHPVRAMDRAEPATH